MKILYLNLDSRPDRREQAEAEFKRVCISPDRVPAIVSENAPLSFNKSVYRAMELAKGDSILLLEDDVVFDCDGALMLSKYYDELPKDFMSFHIGSNIIGMNTTAWKMPTTYSKNLATLHNCWQSHCTLYSKECVQYILDNFKFVTDEYLTEGCQIFDEWLRVTVLPLERSFVAKPMIAYQRESFSNIWNVPANYLGAHTQGNEWLKNNL